MSTTAKKMILIKKSETNKYWTFLPVAKLKPGKVRHEIKVSS